MKARELQGECDRWGVQTSGRKEELLARLKDLYDGKLVLKKGCTTKYVRLLSGPAPATASITLKGTTTETKSDNEFKKVAGTFRDRGAVGSASAPASRQVPGSSTSAGYPTSPPRAPTKVGRSPAPDEKHPGPSFGPDGRQFDPRDGTIIPKDIRLNQACPEIRCGADGRSMVLRRGFNLFFGCSAYPACQFTRTLQEGLAHRDATGGR